jgi:hypothetical protein
MTSLSGAEPASNIKRASDVKPASKRDRPSKREPASDAGAEVGAEPVRAPLVLPSWLDPALRGLGFAVALGLAAASAVYEAFLAPLSWHQTRLPLSVVVAVAANLALVWFTLQVTGRRLAVAGPAVVWAAVMVTAASRTTEGDLVLTSSNWVGLATMLAGCVAFAAGAYPLILAAGRPPRSEPGPPR